MMHLKFKFGPNNPNEEPILRRKFGVERTDGPSSTTEDNFKNVNLSNWREKLKTSRQRNLYVLKESILTDVTFEVGPNRTSFRAHKHILAFGSSVFEAMFFGGLAEKGDTVTIPDIAPEGFEVLLKYLYSDEASFKDEDQGFKAWIAADKYCVSSLKEECVQYLSGLSLSIHNIWRMLENSLSIEETTLVDMCLEYLKTSPETVFTSEGFMDISTEAAKRVLLLDSLNVSELALLKCLVAWGKNRVTAEESDSLQDALHLLLRHVRFGALSSHEFCGFLDETGGLISDSDALAILKHLTEPMSHPLPSWCCDITWRRHRTPQFRQYISAQSNKRQRFDDLGNGIGYFPSAIRQSLRFVNPIASPLSFHSSDDYNSCDDGPTFGDFREDFSDASHASSDNSGDSRLSFVAPY